MPYQIEDYDPDFIPKQVELGSKIMKDWKYNSQSTEEHLKIVYAQDNFQPKFKIYVFDEENLVGYK